MKCLHAVLNLNEAVYESPHNEEWDSKGKRIESDSDAMKPASRSSSPGYGKNNALVDYDCA
jgi:hypothetical protein